MEKYEKPISELELFPLVSVITTSGDPTDDNDNNFGD